MPPSFPPKSAPKALGKKPKPVKKQPQKDGLAAYAKTAGKGMI